MENFAHDELTSKIQTKAMETLVALSRLFMDNHIPFFLVNHLSETKI